MIIELPTTCSDYSVCVCFDYLWVFYTSNNLSICLHNNIGLGLYLYLRIFIYFLHYYLVLAADIQCSVSPDPVDAGSTLTTLCSIAYEGKWAPVMTCSSSDLTASATSDISTSNLAKISYTGTATGGSTSGSLSCEAHFENPASPSEVGTNEADNIPSYTSTWSGTFGVYSK